MLQQHIVRAFFALILCSVYSEQQGCEPPDYPIGGFFEPYKPVYERDEQIHYTCEPGRHLASGALIRTCQGISKINAWYWTDNDPECALVDCGQPNIPNAYFDTPEVTTYQSTMNYRCNDGWAPLGNQVAECSSNATWRFTACSEPEFHCGEPPQVSHARPNVSETTRQQHGTAIHYRCNSGYTMQGADETLVCEQTTWKGSMPSCVQIEYPITTPPPVNQPSTLSKNVLSIVAGVVTAVLLTTALTITILCLRKRQKKSEQTIQESIEAPLPGPSSSQTACRQHQPGEPIKLTENSTIPKCSTVGQEAAASDSTLPYHMIQCPHDHRPMAGIENRRRNNYVPDSHFRPLFSNYEQAQSSSPSTVQSEVSVTDSEFHTIRECLGDFKNNNLPNNTTTPVHNTTTPVHNTPQVQPPQHHNHTMGHPHPHPNLFAHGSRATNAPFSRTLWTADGRPYETVTCPHGVDHVYQPLEHIYEEPHIWMRPLPEPQH